MIGRIVRGLRDLDAFITSHGQCVRCRRSWRTAAMVSVGYALRTPGQRDTSYFCLCIKCFLHEKLSPSAGLVLQGWAARAMDDQATRDPSRRREILAAYGMAHRFPVEVESGWLGSGHPDSYRVRVIDERRRNRLGRADLSPTGERVASLPAKQCGQCPRMAGRCPDHHFDDAPGWNGAGADVEAQRG